MEQFQMSLMSLLEQGNSLLWGKIMIWLLLGTGVFYTARLRFPQIRYFAHMFKVTLKGRAKGEEGGITSFQALCTGLAAQVGTGNLAGVATALASGGPGAIFWMWMTALVGMATVFAEAILAQVFRVRNEDGTYRGGPAYYIERGLGAKWAAVAFSICIIISMAFVFNAVQCNSIAAGVSVAFGVNNHITALVVIALTSVVIFGGIRRIAQVAEIVVPVMAGLYILTALFVVLKHIDMLPSVIKLIFSSAFGAQQVAGGVLGHTVAKAFRYGVARGLFSNEAGMGSTPNAHATAEVKHPARQGFIAMLGVFVDTVLVCTATGAIILLSGTLESGKTGIELTQLAVKTGLGDFGPLLIAVAIIFFAWTSILGNYYYGESNLRYLFPKIDRGGMSLYRILVLGMVYFGAIGHVPLVWEMADFFNGIMAMINLVGILLLSTVTVKVFENYEKLRGEGSDDPRVDPEFVKSFYRK